LPEIHRSRKELRPGLGLVVVLSCEILDTNVRRRKDIDQHDDRDPLGYFIQPDEHLAEILRKLGRFSVTHLLQQGHNPAVVSVELGSLHGKAIRHTLRHTRAIRLMQSGVDGREAAGQIGV
jgi:hypothetical protein